MHFYNGQKNLLVNIDMMQSYVLVYKFQIYMSYRNIYPILEQTYIERIKKIIFIHINFHF